MSDPDYDAQMRDWARKNGVRPLQVDNRLTTPIESARGSNALRWRDAEQRRFYAGWEAYDSAPKTHWDLIAEIHALESWWRL